jgi:hypothetical protein
MPLLTAPPPAAAEVRPFWEVDDLAFLQGDEGQQVRLEIELVGQHWREQALGSLQSEPTDLIDELQQYRHVPFERVGTRRVRFRAAKPLLPRRLTFDDDEQP